MRETYLNDYYIFNLYQLIRKILLKYYMYILYYHKIKNYKLKT